MTKRYMKSEILAFAKPLKETEGLSHRLIAKKVNTHFNLIAHDRWSMGDVRSLLKGVKSTTGAGPYDEQLAQILNEHVDSLEGGRSFDYFLLETSDTQKSNDDYDINPHTPSVRRGGET